ncbi:MAG: SH3 domain-containing protein [Clostridiaceae bacterium]|nr:SH3 domain-containing protein [Eubacteriales bacterium]
MKRRLLALALLFSLAVAVFPAGAAQATVLNGMVSKVDYENTDPNRYYIELDLVNQIITVYEGGPAGVIVLQSLLSSGNEENPSGSGTYRLGPLKERFGYFVAFGQYAQYWTQVVRGVYIHSVMYDSRKLSSMSRPAYNNLGKAVSHGCIRVLPHVAQWVFYNCPPGTVCKLNTKAVPNPDLVKSIKAGIPSFSSYAQPSDAKPDPVEIPAVIRTNSVPLRTGFSTVKDTTVATLSANDRVMLLQLADDWCKVRVVASGKLGYVKTQYLLAYPDEPVTMHEGYKATSKTYVYEKANTDAKRLVTIPKGSEVTVTGDGGKKGWYAGTFNGVTGYVRAKYVQGASVMVFPYVEGFSAVPVAPAAPAPGAEATATGARVKDGRTVNFRAAASPDAPVIAVLSAGTPVTVLSMDGNWYYCAVNGVNGYLHYDGLVF